MIAVLLALLLQVPATPEEILAQACPKRRQHVATADERAIIAAVAEHYRQFESSVAERHQKNYIVTAGYGRHAVPSKKAPQVFLLDSLALPFVIDASLHLEMQRHGLPRALADQLVGQLKTRNATPVEWSKPGEFVPLSCRDVYGMMLMGPPPAGRDLTNASAALLFALPAFDAAKQHAAVLSINDIEVLLEGKWGNLELSLLKRNAAGGWQLEWDTTVSHARQGATAESVRPSDLAIFEAILARLGGTVRVVNQTLSESFRPPDLAKSAPAAFADLQRRSNGSIYLGGHKIQHAELVQRETLQALDANRLLGSATAAVWLALPGYDGNDAVVVYTLVRRTESGYEKGEAVALLERTDGVWRVKRDDFRRWMGSPR